MAAIDQIIKINISQQTQAVAQASFSIPLIVGPTVPDDASVADVYTSPEAMLANGYTTSSPEYIYALELYEQPLTPTEFVVGLRTTAIAQVDTIVVGSLVGVPGHVYHFTINGVVVSYTSQVSDSYAQIIAGLNAAYATAFPTNAPTTNVVSGSGSGTTLTLTSVTPGANVLYSAVDSELTHVLVTANNGIQDDINKIIAANNAWYGMCICEATDADILQAAALIEALKKIYIAVSDTAAIAQNVSTDVGSVLKSKSYKRTGLIFTAADFVNEGKDAAWLGGQLPQVPGSNNWAFKTLFGCTVDVLTDNQQSILIGDPVAGVPGKNVNIYQTVGGQNITEMGTMAGGQFIDVTVGVDWLQATLQTNLFSALVNSNKIPYTDNGTTVLISAVKSAIDQGVANGLIDGNSPITISAPQVLSVPQNQRAQRIAPTISFSCRLAGAYNAIVISGTVTV